MFIHDGDEFVCGFDGLTSEVFGRRKAAGGPAESFYYYVIFNFNRLILCPEKCLIL